MARFDGKVVLITGAASGIGATAARAFADEGAQLALIDRPESAFPADIGQRAGMTVHCDIGDDGHARDAVDRCVSTLGGIDVLVHNAGYPVQGPKDDLTPDEWRAHFEADVHGIYFSIRAARQALIRSKGCMVNVTSVAALGGDPGMPAYDAAKGAALRLTNSLALELGPYGVRVNAVCPTLTRTHNSKKVEQDPELYARIKASIPLRRIAEPEDVAAAILWLSSTEAGFINGVGLPVDGGLSAGNGQPDMTGRAA